MIYIGKNIYIDESLITCAEYQLFLDERRSYGYFLQPDHWETHTFPNGQGLAPIAGVRSSDAVAFCTWLTERDPGIWQYRLPTREEQRRLESERNLHLSMQEEMGYWIENGNAFAWIKSTPPIDPLARMMQEVLKRYSVKVHPHILNKICSQTLILDLQHTWKRLATLELDTLFYSTLAHAQILTEARYSNHASARNLVEYLTYARFTLPQLVRSLEQGIYDHRRAYSRTITSLLDCSCTIVKIFDHIRKLGLEGSEKFEYPYEQFLAITAKLLLLDARIRKESPAREGIVLVRKRQSS